MVAMLNNQEWENRYQQRQTGWDRGAASPNLRYWLDSAYLIPCRILVPGCGNGHEVVALAAQGFDVVAIDIAPTPINNLRQALDLQNLTAELVQADFLEWRTEAPFDAIYEQTSLCALPPEIWPQYENSLYQWLKPKGKLFAQFMQTGKEDGPPFHCEVDAMNGLFDSQRWLWSDEHKTDVIHSEDLEDLNERAFILYKNA